MKLKYSSDGIHWVLPKHFQVNCTTAVRLIMIRSAASKYILSLKTINGIYRRSRNYLEHEDPEMLVSLALGYMITKVTNLSGIGFMPTTMTRVILNFRNCVHRYITMKQCPMKDICWDILQFGKDRRIIFATV